MESVISFAAPILLVCAAMAARAILDVADAFFGMLHAGQIDMGAFAANLLVVSAGNIVGGAVFVALVYWLVYVRPRG